MQSREEQFD
nr:unnamed protein product [Callosobruchus chinensis]CAH7760692.1 unnamed protein product [Callosobruchus chinensis]